MLGTRGTVRLSALNDWVSTTRGWGCCVWPSHVLIDIRNICIESGSCLRNWISLRIGGAFHQRWLSLYFSSYKYRRRVCHPMLFIRSLHLHQISVAIRRSSTFFLFLYAPRIAHLTSCDLFWRYLWWLVWILFGALSFDTGADSFITDTWNKDDILDLRVDLIWDLFNLLNVLLLETSHMAKERILSRFEV